MRIPNWTAMHPNVTVEHLGLLPEFLDSDDPRPAKEQFHERYAHGGGWHPFKGFKLLANYGLTYPGDPVMYPIAKCELGDEVIYLYPHAWVMILQPDGSFEVARMD